MPETKGYEPAPPSAEDPGHEWLESLIKVEGSMERRTLARLSREIVSRASPEMRDAMEPIWAVETPVGAHLHRGSLVEQVVRVYTFDENMNEVSYADLFVDRGNRHLVLFTAYPRVTSDAGRALAQEAARAMCAMFGERAWVSWAGAPGESPRIAEVHVPFELPDPKEGEHLHAALGEAWASRDDARIQRALAAVADALDRRLPFSRSIVPSYAADLGYVEAPNRSASDDLWRVSFGSGTGGTRLLLDERLQALSFPSQGIGLSWDFQDGMRRLFGERAHMPHPDRPLRSLTVPLSAEPS